MSHCMWGPLALGPAGSDPMSAAPTSADPVPTTTPSTALLAAHKKVSSLPVKKKSPLGPPRLGAAAGRQVNGQSSGSSGSSSLLLCCAVLSPPEFGDQWKRKKNSIDFLAIKIPVFLPPSIVPPGTDGCLFLGRPSSDHGERRKLGIVVLPAQQLRQSSARPAAGSGGRRRRPGHLMEGKGALSCSRTRFPLQDG